MVDIAPFRGIRYDPAVVGTPGDVLAPPYDIISPTDRAHLYAKSLRNIVRIDFGKDYPDDVPGINDRYTRARGHANAWKELGVFVNEPTPAIYISGHRFVDSTGTEHTRYGITAAVNIAGDHPDLLTHERTAPSPVDDRYLLMQNTHLATSAVFGLWQYSGSELRSAIHTVIATEPIFQGRTNWHDSHEEHTLWAITDPIHIATIQQAFLHARVLVADGHHRLAASIAYAKAHPNAAAAQYCLMYLVDAYDPSVLIEGTHRILSVGSEVAISFSNVETVFQGMFAWHTVPNLEEGIAYMLTRESTGRRAWILAYDGKLAVLSSATPTESLRSQLPVSIVDELVVPKLAALFGLPQEELVTHVEYTHDALDVVKATMPKTDTRSLGIILPACTVDDILSVAEQGDVMPRKSTYFTPKVPTGLVLYPLSSADDA